VRAATDLQRVVAAHHGVALAQVGDHHRVVHEVRLRAGEDRVHRVEEVVVGRQVGVHLQRQVRHHLQQLALEPQDRPPERRVVGAQVGVHERVGQHAVEGPPERSQGAHELVDVEPAHERRQHLVEVAEVDGVAGDRRHLRVHGRQEPEGVGEVGRRRQLEVRGALPESAPVVGQQVARAVGGVALEHVADDPCLLRCPAGVAHRRRRERLLGEPGEPLQALPVRQRRVFGRRAHERAQVDAARADALRADALRADALRADALGPTPWGPTCGSRPVPPTSAIGIATSCASSHAARLHPACTSGTRRGEGRTSRRGPLPVPPRRQHRHVHARRFARHQLGHEEAGDRA
jgi:hypothetical protein